MKIKNLKYIFGVVVGLLLFACNVSFGNCTPGMISGTSSYPIPGNGQQAGQCRSYASDQGDAWYNNKSGLNDDGNLFLKMIGRSWVECNSTSVKNFQTVMQQQIGGSCSTCIDGRAGHHTRDAMSQCVAMLCPSDSNLKKPKLVNGDYACEDVHDILVDTSLFGFSYKCCKALQCDKYQDSTGGCTSYGPSYTVDGSGCCATSCDKPQGTGGGCTSYGDSYTVDGSGCCATSCDKPQDAGGGCASYGSTYILSGTCCVENSCPNPPDVTDPENPTCPSGYILGGGGCCEEASSICGGDNQYLPEGGTSSSDCAECEEGTKPNETHTKCICDSSKKCCGIQLNTVVPFIGDCIEMNTDSSRGDTTSVTSVTAFPILVQGLMKILMSAIMVFSFLMVIIAGLMMTTGAFSSGNFAKGKTILKNVIISLILLGCSGLILSLVNPSFFGG